MATRFRFPASGAAPVSPAFQSYTHATGLSTPRRNLPTADTTALATQALAPDAADHLVAGDTLFAQFISAPLAAQAFTAGDAFDMALQALEANAGNNLQVQVWIGIVSNDGTTALATLRSKVLEGAEVNTALRNTYFSSTLSGSYTTSGGERLVVELSMSGTPTGAGGVQGHNGSLRLGGNGAGGDLPENDTDTGTTLNPWIEFANTITFQGNRRRRVIAAAG